MATQLEVLLKGGYSRLLHDGEFLDIAEMLASPETIPVSAEGFELLVDRLSVSDDSDEKSRLADSAETAFFEGHGSLVLTLYDADVPRRLEFSKRFESSRRQFVEPNDLMFNFNNPYGACPRCEGFGRVIGISEDLVVPDRNLSVYDDAVACWKGEKMGQWKQMAIAASGAASFPVHKPYCQLTEQERSWLWHGGAGGFEGIDGFFRMVEENLYKIQYRVLQARYRGKTECPECHGSRLRSDASYVSVAGKTITEMVKMPVDALHSFFENIDLPAADREIAAGC